MAEMGGLVGVTRQTWRDWELGVTFPTADKLDLIAAALDLDSVAELFEEGNGAA
jgi:transcriptional regulator with XRE-family HTH domain